MTARHGACRPPTGSPMLRGEIRLVDLDPVRGSEANKRHPAVIISNDRANSIAARLGRGVVTVLPVTSNVERIFASKRCYPQPRPASGRIRKLRPSRSAPSTSSESVQSSGGPLRTS